jgi:enhancing lycopene biosynthesis protein 2
MAFEGSNIHPTLTLGSALEPSPYDINGFNEGLKATGSMAEERTIREVLIDPTNRIICAPCYMMEARITEIHENIQHALRALKELL